MSTDRVSRIAERLADARRKGLRIKLEGDDTPRDFDDAQAIQDKLVALLGQPIVGWKVIEMPDGRITYAPLLKSGIVAAGGTWTTVGPEPAGIELEIAFRMAKDVPAGAKGDAILDCVSGAHIVYELCQSRLNDPSAQPRHVSVADCIFNTGIVIGGELPDWRKAEYKGRQGRLLVDGKVHAEGKSNDPIRALQVLAPALEKAGKRLSAGQTVITGSLIGMNWLNGRHALVGQIDGFADVALNLVAA